MKNNNQRKKIFLKLLEPRDLTRVNYIRYDIMKLGGDYNDLPVLRTSHKNLDRISMWVQQDKRVSDVMKTALTILMVIDSNEWHHLSRANSYREINRVLKPLLDQRAGFHGGTLWDFIDTRHTSAQLGSGMALEKWESTTIGAVMQMGDEIASVYRG